MEEEKIGFILSEKGFDKIFEDENNIHYKVNDDLLIRVATTYWRKGKEKGTIIRHEKYVYYDRVLTRKGVNAYNQPNYELLFYNSKKYELTKNIYVLEKYLKGNDWYYSYPFRGGDVTIDLVKKYNKDEIYRG